MEKLQELDEEIETILAVGNHPDFIKYDWQLKRLTRILDKLNLEKERQQMQFELEKRCPFCGYKIK